MKTLITAAVAALTITAQAGWGNPIPVVTDAKLAAATNATLIAANRYTDEHGGGSGGVKTNDVEAIVSEYDVTNLTLRISAKADALTEAQTNAVNSGVTETKVGSWDDHVGDTTNNPHQVTAEQVGAMPLRGAVVENATIKFYSSEEGGIPYMFSEFTDGEISTWNEIIRQKTSLDPRGISHCEYDRSYSFEFPQKSGMFALTSDIPPPPGDYAAISNAAMTAHRDATNYTDSVGATTLADANGYTDSVLDYTLTNAASAAAVALRSGEIVTVTTDGTGDIVLTVPADDGRGADCILRVVAPVASQIASITYAGGSTSPTVEWLCDPLTVTGSIPAGTTNYVFIFRATTNTFAISAQEVK